MSPRVQHPLDRAHVVAELSPITIYIGRAGRGQSGLFGNPYLKGAVCSRCSHYHPNAGSTLPCFRAYFENRTATDPEFRARVLALKGKALWCPGRCKARCEPCHGDIIVEWVEANS